MEKTLLTGRIVFEPENKTKKHFNQSSWKHIAMVFIDGDVTEYYAWFIQKRYNLTLNKPLRGAHISFINDSFKDMSLGGQRTQQEVKTVWESVKRKWDGVTVPIMLDLKPRFDKTHWWLNVHPEYRDTLQSIRGELGLGKPFFGMHMSLGYANEKNLPHHQYITRGIINNLIP